MRPDKLRFDFTHPSALTAEERAEVEKRVNEHVFANPPVRIFETPLEEARNARRDDALRGEVRRRRARRRHRRLVGRALRRHARALDRGDRAVRDPLRELGRRRRAADRGGHRGRGVRAAARAGARGRRAARRARDRRARSRSAPAQAAAGRDRRSSGQGGRRRPRRGEGPARAGRCATSPTGSASRRRRTARSSRRVDDGRVFLVVNFDESLVERGLDASQVVRELGKHIGGGGRRQADAGARRAARTPTASPTRSPPRRSSSALKMLA